MPNLLCHVIKMVNPTLQSEATDTNQAKDFINIGIKRSFDDSEKVFSFSRAQIEEEGFLLDLNFYIEYHILSEQDYQKFFDDNLHILTNPLTNLEDIEEIFPSHADFINLATKKIASELGNKTYYSIDLENFFKKTIYELNEKLFVVNEKLVEIKNKQYLTIFNYSNFLKDDKNFLSIYIKILEDFIELCKNQTHKTPILFSILSEAHFRKTPNSKSEKSFYNLYLYFSFCQNFAYITFLYSENLNTELYQELLARLLKINCINLDENEEIAAILNKHAINLIRYAQDSKTNDAFAANNVQNTNALTKLEYQFILSCYIKNFFTDQTIAQRCSHFFKYKTFCNFIISNIGNCDIKNFLSDFLAEQREHAIERERKNVFWGQEAVLTFNKYCDDSKFALFIDPLDDEFFNAVLKSILSAKNALDDKEFSVAKYFLEANITKEQCYKSFCGYHKKLFNLRSLQSVRYQTLMEEWLVSSEMSYLFNIVNDFFLSFNKIFPHLSQKNFMINNGHFLYLCNHYLQCISTKFVENITLKKTVYLLLFCSLYIRIKDKISLGATIKHLMQQSKTIYLADSQDEHLIQKIKYLFNNIENIADKFAELQFAEDTMEGNESCSCAENTDLINLVPQVTCAVLGDVLSYLSDAKKVSCMLPIEENWNPESQLAIMKLFKTQRIDCSPHSSLSETETLVSCPMPQQPLEPS